VFKRSDRRKPNTKFIRNFRQLSDKSFVDDFDWTGYCKYESRLVLRSTEIKPLFHRFVCTILRAISKWYYVLALPNKTTGSESLQQWLKFGKKDGCFLLGR